MGDEFPSAEVQATDLSPIQPSSVPENVHFFIDDASEDDWAMPPENLDYIHTRVLLGCFTDFRDIIRRGFHYLQPGGFMESQEIMSTPYCDDVTMQPDWEFLEWSNLCQEAAEKASRPLKIAQELKKWYEEAGFVDVQEKVFKIPINPWPEDKHLKALGAMWEENMLAGLSGFSMAPFSRALQWSKDEIQVSLTDIHCNATTNSFDTGLSRQRSEIHLGQERSCISQGVCSVGQET